MAKRLSDREIEEQLLEMFSLDDPENSEDENEDVEDYFGEVPNLRTILEGVDEFSEHSITARPSTSSETVAALDDLDAARPTTSSSTATALEDDEPALSNTPLATVTALDDVDPARQTTSSATIAGLDEDESVRQTTAAVAATRTRTQNPRCQQSVRPNVTRSSNNRRSRPNVIHSSDSEQNDSDQDETEWKKVMWEDRPDPEHFDELKLKPSVYFPSRTNPKAYFTRFFDDNVLELIVEQTNLYAAEKRSRNWEPVTTTEIKMFIGMLILMSFHNLPSYNLYWSSDPFFRVDEIAQVMTYKRLKKILENLHLNDNSKMPAKDEPNYDKLYKVRPLIDMINNACQREAKISTSQSIDEAMIKFKGRSSLKQYMPLKPIKRGFKVWVRADSETGYVYEFQIYTGKSNDKVPEFGLGENVVKLLTKSLIDAQIPAHVTFDNFFASYGLMQYLFEHGIHCTATVNPIRSDLPKLIKNKEKAKTNRKELERGQYKWRVKNDVAFIVLMDKKPVTILTTAFHPTIETVCNRTLKDGTTKEFPCPLAMAQYSKRMGGVDRFDQKRGTYDISRRSKKWWRRIFYFLVDLSITNAYNLYQGSVRVQSHLLSNMSFRIVLARGLICGQTTHKRKLDCLPNYAERKIAEAPLTNYQKAIGVPDDIRFSNVGNHFPHEINNYRRCRLCSTKTVNKRSKIICSQCLVPLCVYPYFSGFHAK